MHSQLQLAEGIRESFLEEVSIELNYNRVQGLRDWEGVGRQWSPGSLLVAFMSKRRTRLNCPVLE
jgi:hypothetical protein